jgi:peptidyl-prolyl cis-trans isomerase D
MVLQAIRERLTGIIAIFIFGILIIPFAFVGVSSYFTSDNLNNIAVVNEEPIAMTDFTQSFQTYRMQMQRMLGASYDPNAYDSPIVKREHLDSMIDRALVRQVSLEAGLSVADDRLAEEIRNTPGFQVDGVFNPDVYQASLQANAITPLQYENQLRAGMVMNQFPATIAGSSIVTNRELEEFVRLQGQVRAFSAVLVPVELPGTEPEVDGTETGSEFVEPDTEAPAEPEPADPDSVLAEISEEELVEFYEANQFSFISEEKIILEYIELDAATIGGSVDPDEEQLRARFEQQKARFITPESRLASHILISVDPTAGADEIEAARVEAQGVRDQFGEGVDFAELARTYSQDEGSAGEGGDLGWVEPTIMVQAFEDALYELSLEAPVSDPVQTGFGWHVIQLREIRPAEGMSFEEARETIATEYRDEADERRFIEQADRMVDLIYEDPTTLEAAADELGLEIQLTEAFGRAGGMGITANPDVVRAAWSDLVLLQGSVSDPVDIGTNHMVMVRMAQHLPEAVPPLEEIRDQVSAAVVAERASDNAFLKAEGLLVRIREGVTPAEVAEAEGLELLEHEAAIRTGGELRPDVLAALFSLEPPAEGEATIEQVQLADGYAVISLTGVSDGKLEEGEELTAQNYRLRIANALGNQETLGFIKMLRSQSEIEVFEDKL